MKIVGKSLLWYLSISLLLSIVVCQGTYPLKIVTYFNAMDNRYSKQTGTNKDKYLFSKQIMLRVVKYYSSLMSVKTPEAKYSYTEFVLIDGITKVPAGSFTGHLFTVFDCYNKDDTTFASAAFQDQDPANGRPISGSFELNLDQIQPSPRNVLAHYGVFVHEFYHILALHSDLFQYYRNSAGAVIGLSNIIGTVGGRTVYKYPGEVLNYAKTFLSDSSLTSIIMENGGGEGSAGSHWEYDYWPTDFMSPTDTVPSLLTPLSMYLARDAGWYTVNDDFLDPQIYGKGAGANFQSTANCPGDRNPKPLGFCATADKSKQMCAPDGMYKGKCDTDPTYNNNGGCPFIMGSLYCSVPSNDYTNEVNYDVEIIGASSRCSMIKSSSGYIAACATATCSGTTLTYKFNGSGNTCSCTAADAGQDKACGTQTVRCPDVVSLGLTCDSLDASKHACPNDCSGKGFCLGLTAGKKQCWCSYGWTSGDCSTANPDEPPVTISGNVALLKFISFYGGALVMILTLFI